MTVYAEEATSPFAYEAITVAGTAVGFTAAVMSPGGGPGAVRAFVTSETAEMRYRTDGTDPTATEGHLLTPNDRLVFEGAATLAQFRAIRTGGTSGVLRITYER